MGKTDRNCAQSYSKYKWFVESFVDSAGQTHAHVSKLWKLKLSQYSWSHVTTIQVKQLKITPHLLPLSPLPITTPCSSKIITMLTSYTVDVVFIFCFGLHVNEIFHCVFCGISFFPRRSFLEPLAISHHLIQSEMEITLSWSLLGGLWISTDGSLLSLCGPSHNPGYFFQAPTSPWNLKFNVGMPAYDSVQCFYHHHSLPGNQENLQVQAPSAQLTSLSFLLLLALGVIIFYCFRSCVIPNTFNVLLLFYFYYYFF